MMFVGQFPIPDEPMRLAYLFITDDTQGTVETFSPEAGENALLVQPEGRIPPFLMTTDAATGPSLWRRDSTWDEHVPVELAVYLAPLDLAAEATLESEIGQYEAYRKGAPLDQLEAVEVRGDALPPYSYLGGKAHLWQTGFHEIPADWRFHFQLDGGDGPDDPYALNFGGGTGYGFLSPDLCEGRFFWDCV